MAIIFLGLVGVAAVLAIIGVFIAAIVVAGCIFLFVVFCCVPCVVVGYRKWQARRNCRDKDIKYPEETCGLKC